MLGFDSGLGRRFFRLALLLVDVLDVLGRILWRSSDEEAYLVESFRIGFGLSGFFDQLGEGCDRAVLQPLIVELRDDDGVLQCILRSQLLGLVGFFLADFIKHHVLRQLAGVRQVNDIREISQTERAIELAVVLQCATPNPHVEAFLQESELV